jgi:hypothetical protein
MREGGCACGAIRYSLTEEPLIVHACHCRDCQRMTGGPFVINLWIERKFVRASGTPPRSIVLRGGSGKEHRRSSVAHAELTCGATTERAERLLVRARGTLDAPDAIVPDITSSRTKLPWIELPAGMRAVETATSWMRSGGPRAGAPAQQPAHRACRADLIRSADRL